MKGEVRSGFPVLAGLAAALLVTAVIQLILSNFQWVTLSLVGSIALLGLSLVLERNLQIFDLYGK